MNDREQRLIEALRQTIRLAHIMSEHNGQVEACKAAMCRQQIELIAAIEATAEPENQFPDPPNPA